MEQVLPDKDREQAEGAALVQEEEETKEIALVQGPWEIVFVLPVEKK